VLNWSPPSFVIAARRLFHYKIAFFIGWSSISFYFCRIAFSSSCKFAYTVQTMTLCSCKTVRHHIEPRQLGIFFETLFLISDQCWSMGNSVTSLTRLEPFIYVIQFGTSCKNLCSLWGATWTHLTCILLPHYLEKCERVIYFNKVIDTLFQIFRLGYSDGQITNQITVRNHTSLDKKN